MPDAPAGDNPFRKRPPGWGARPATPDAAPASPVAAADAGAAPAPPAIGAAVVGRGVGLAILAWLTWRTIAGGLAWPRPGGVLTVLDGANFIFHEGGHFIFMFFGEFIAVAGGSLNQVLIPAIVTGYFFWHRQTASAAATLYWTGQSLTGVAVYAADGVAMRLPLHGGEGPAVHDWHRLLRWTGLLDHGTAVGRVLFAIAVLTMLAALVVLALDTLRAYRHPDAPDDSVA